MQDPRHEARTGSLPLTIGNQWTFSATFTPVEETTWGGVKALYR